MGYQTQLKQFLHIAIFLCMGLGGNAQTRDNKVVLLMPFCSKLTVDNPSNSYAQLSNLSREYYQGALIALDSIKKMDIPLSFTVLDTENDSNVTVALLKKQAMRDCDLIIGPVLQGGNKVISNFVKEKNILHVSPLMTLSKTKFNDPNLISPNPNLSYYPKFIYERIKQQVVGEECTIIIVSDKSSFDKTITAAFKQLQLTQKNIKLKVIEYTRSLDLQSIIQAGKMNHIVVPTSSEMVVNSVLKNISDTSLLSHTTFYGFPQWLEFKNPDYRIWEQANVRVATPFFVNYEREEVKSFISLYRERFYTEPTEAAFKGYDQTLFLCKGLNESGLKMVQQTENNPVRLLGSTYSFKKPEEKSGYQNTYIYFVGVQSLKWVVFE
jgi:ABC-type branched-subunit amino acid transport system substrate-binding protein